MTGKGAPGPDRETLEGILDDQALREVLESLPNPVYVKDRAGVFVACNRAMEAHLGSKREEILGRRAEVLFPPEEARVFVAKDEELLRAGGRQVFQAGMQGQEGPPRQFLHSRTLWIDAGGDVAGIIGQCQDITDLHENEAAHRENEARLKAALESLQEREAQFRALFMAGDGIKLLLATEGGWILDANPAAEAFLGYDLPALRTMSITQFSGLGEEELVESVERIIRRQGGEYERRYRVASGDVREVEVHAAPVEIKGKTYLWATLHDITEGKRAGAALRESEERFKTLAESVEVIIFRFDLEGRCTYVNGHFQRVTGIAPGRALAGDWGAIIHPGDLASVLEGWEKARRLQQVQEAQFRLLGREEEVWVLGRTTPERDFEGRLVGFLSTCTDITRFRRAEEALRHASRQEGLGRLAGNIANDFNNILQAAWTSLDLADASLKDPAKVQEALAFARGSLGKAKRITQFIHQYSGQGAHRPVPVDLGACVEEFVASATLPGADLRLETGAAQALPRVRVDPEQVVQCLKAVVANAVEALGGSGGTIRITVRKPARFHAAAGVWIIRSRPGEAVELVVENDGPPIPREELPRIFDPYYTTKEKGRGLGLASVLGIVRAHQAALWAESPPGSGVRIHFLWPTERPAEAETAAPRGGSGALLVVDDEEGVRKALSRALAERMGREVLVAASGEEAVAVVRAQKGTLGAAIVDANMPGMDGTAAFRAMRALQPGLPGILVSGCDEEEGGSLARAHGFSRFIKKPFEVEALREALEAAISLERNP